MGYEALPRVTVEFTYFGARGIGINLHFRDNGEFIVRVPTRCDSNVGGHAKNLHNFI